ncbi:gamma-glutamyl-gamma-aminobutyrate hydrolase family protein [Mangrovibacterium lignilyticum]|uniref:gamma-glutamyl-gamma-aminobutyrate hydrolase family protein n=1 Tax=Mangrovibacterium lignilyticum TaxID=2668052 RepID=UPI0013D2D9F2|nr:gamma-glutamyl-gamma-aminobutyrate hydrolase family protein [Mangrovibacterium lignilyticum]
MKVKRIYLQFLLIFSLFISTPVFAQNFFNTDYDPAKTYILLTHPTVENIEKIRYLIDQRLLFVGETEFIGIYFYAERYDYSQTIRYIRDNNLDKFHLQRLTGTLTIDNIFEPNDFTNNFDIMFSQSKGILLFGGTDIQPEIYGETKTLSEVTDPERHLMELSFVFHLLGSNKNPNFTPFLERNPKYFVIGFDLGMQTMNVATGGTMIQDIPTELYNAKTPQEIVQLNRDDIHRNYWQEIFDNPQLMPYNFHPLRLEIGSFFQTEVHWNKNNISPKVLSNHHQSVENLNDCWEITARSMDGKVIEGIRHKKYPNVFGVQFLPDEPGLFEEKGQFKFAPRDVAESYYQIIGKDGYKFHKLFWKRISKAAN